MSQTPIRDAATVILVRDADSRPRVLMGQRGAKAAFMPSKFVFPGGAVDAGDAAIPALAPIGAACHARLSADSQGPGPETLGAAAVRELWEETGQILGGRGNWTGDVPPDWHGFAAAGFLPDPSALRFIFRAITPPGRPRRFDARFFLADARHLATDADDFSAATDELSHLHWVDVAATRNLDLPFITSVVLAEVAARLPDLDPPASVPFFRNSDEDSLFLRLQGG